MQSWGVKELMCCQPVTQSIKISLLKCYVKTLRIFFIIVNITSFFLNTITAHLEYPEIVHINISNTHSNVLHLCYYGQYWNRFKLEKNMMCDIKPSIKLFSVIQNGLIFPWTTNRTPCILQVWNTRLNLSSIFNVTWVVLELNIITNF